MAKKSSARPKPRPEKPRVEVVNRPLFHEGTKQLERRFFQAKNDQDLDALHALRHELSFRRQPQSRALAEEVQKALDCTSQRKPEPPQEQAGTLVLTPERGPQPTLPFPVKAPLEPAPDTPLRDVLDWLETVAKDMTDEQARALRESLKARYPGFAEFAAEREGGTK